MKERRSAVLLSVGVLTTYIFSVLAINFISPDEVIPPEEFPEICPENSSNCSMIGPNSHRSGGQTELRFNTSIDHVMFAAASWAESEPRTDSIGEWPGQHHYVFRSMIFRFPDDFLIKVFCDEGDSVVHVFSESRLGISDMGVNEERVIRFAEHMSVVEMPTSECIGE